MTALTTDSDTGPDSPGTSDRGNRPPRQVTPRVFHAPDHLGSAPSFPPRIDRPGDHTEMNCRIFAQRHGRPSERPCPRNPPFGRVLAPLAYSTVPRDDHCRDYRCSKSAPGKHRLPAAWGHNPLGRIDFPRGSGCVSDTPENVTAPLRTYPWPGCTQLISCEQYGTPPEGRSLA